MNTTNWLYAGLVAGVASMAVAVYLYYWVKRQDAGSEKAQMIAGWIKEGAASYLKKLYGALGIAALILGTMIAVTFVFDIEHLGLGTFEPKIDRGLTIAAAYLIGAFCSAIAGYMGMTVAVRANVRTATAAQTDLPRAFRVAFYAGAVMGLAMIGVGVIGMSGIYLLTRDPEIVLGFSFGASTLSLLAKAGGGIYTKTADIAADLVGKVELGIPEDDPRNPAVVADNVGDNVGDVAGMGADIFDSYIASSVAAMLLGASAVAGGARGAADAYIVLPLILCVVGIVASLISIQFVRVGKSGDPGNALNNGTVISCFLFAGLTAAVVFGFGFNPGVFVATVSGLAIAMMIGFTTGYFTSDKYRPVRETASVAQSGSPIAIITGFSYGLISMIMPILGIVAATLVSYYAAEAFGMSGIYGVGIAAVGMLSLSGIVVSADAYGPIVDNSRGIAEQSGMGREVIERADVLDSAGNTAKAITKGFAIGAAALTVLALFAAFGEVIKSRGGELRIDLQNPFVLAGVFLGALTPPVFAAMTMLAVTRNAFKMIEEIRRQFREHPGILKGTENPDYAACVGMAASGALFSLVGPAILAIFSPLVIGFLLGPDALGGFLGGSIFTGVIFALMMANSGGLWDNAKKYIEAGQFGGPGSDAHKAAVVGDTVSDPFKDTAGPSLNTLITVMSLVASLFAPVIAVFHLFGR